MDKQPGIHGIIVQTKPLGSSISGQFGIVIQLGTNFALTLKTEDNKTVKAGKVEISFVNNSTLTKEVFTYNPALTYQSSLPLNTTISVKIYGPGFAPFESNLSIQAGQFVRLDAIIKYGHLHIRRYKTLA